MADRARRMAAIDIGTVTTRLLVADVGPDGITELTRSTDITHLGEDLTETGRLSHAAMARVRDVICGYAGTMREFGVEHFEAVATSASRDATNSDEFLELLADCGVVPLVVQGSREAYLSFLGATAGLDAQTVLVDDIGGGSTELVLGTAAGTATERRVDIELARSVDIGSRRLTEMFLRSDPPMASELHEARVFAAEELRPYFDALKERPRLLVSVAGTATSVVSVIKELAVYDAGVVHGSTVSGAEVSGVLELLAGMPLARRREVVGLHPERAGVIVAGILILETVMALAGVDSTMVSEHDILYGILLDAYAGSGS